MMIPGNTMDFNYLRHLAELGRTHLHPHSQVATEVLLTHLDLQDGQRILELGCGTGATLLQVAQQKQLWLDGVDILPEMVEAAQKRIKLAGLRARITVQQVQPGERLPFAAATFDRVYAESVLGIQTAQRISQLFTDIHRVLKPEGLFLANEAIWRSGLSQADVDALNERCIRDFGVRQATAEAWYLTHWLTALRQAGFQPLSFELLQNLIDKHVSPPPQTTFASRMSHLFNTLRLWKTALSPHQRAQKRHYRALLQQHAQDGYAIETRLFVLRKGV